MYKSAEKLSKNEGSLTDEQAQYIANKLNRIDILKKRNIFEDLFKEFIAEASRLYGHINLRDLGHILIYVSNEDQQEICVDLLITNLPTNEINQLVTAMLYFELAKAKKDGEASYMREDSLTTKLMKREKDLIFSHKHIFFSIFIKPYLESVIKLINANFKLFSDTNWPEKICSQLIENLNNYLNTVFKSTTLNSLPPAILMNAMTIWQHSEELEISENNRLSLLGGYIILRILNPSIAAFIETNEAKYKKKFTIYQTVISKTFMRPIQQLTNNIGISTEAVNQQENKSNQRWEKTLSENFFLPENMAKIKKYLKAIRTLSIDISDHSENNHHNKKSPRKLHPDKKEHKKVEKIITTAWKKDNFSDLGLRKSSSTHSTQKVYNSNKTTSHEKEKKNNHETVVSDKSEKRHKKKKLRDSKCDKSEKPRKKKKSLKFHHPVKSIISKKKLCPIPSSAKLPTSGEDTHTTHEHFDLPPLSFSRSSPNFFLPAPLTERLERVTERTETRGRAESIASGQSLPNIHEKSVRKLKVFFESKAEPQPASSPPNKQSNKIQGNQSEQQESLPISPKSLSGNK
jgi:hypothetical protein